MSSKVRLVRDSASAAFSLTICSYAACTFQGQPLLRTVIALSAAATLLYTPLLKRLTGIKNATVAAVITASPLAGALAAGAVSVPSRRLLHIPAIPARNSSKPALVRQCGEALR